MNDFEWEKESVWVEPDPNRWKERLMDAYQRLLDDRAPAQVVKVVEAMSENERREFAAARFDDDFDASFSRIYLSNTLIDGGERWTIASSYDWMGVLRFEYQLGEQGVWYYAKAVGEPFTRLREDGFTDKGYRAAMDIARSYFYEG